jgi:tyrosine-protein kinase Etk/Wzc
LEIQKNALSRQEREIDRRMRVLPNTEKQLLEIQRQQAIKQQLYLYLLQKREEAALSLSVTVANNREIEPARFVGQVSPKSKQIQLFSCERRFVFTHLTFTDLEWIK